MYEERMIALGDCPWLHFARGIAEAKCMLANGHGRLCVFVCLALAAFPHYCTDPDVTLGTVRGAL